jgi:transposase-like protein
MLFVPAPHPPEFRLRAVALARLGEKPISAIAKELSISESCLRNWMAQADADDGNTNSRLNTDEKRELAELRKHNRRLGRDERIGPTVVGRPADKCSEQCPVGPGHPWSRGASVHDGDVVAQREDLAVLVRR